MKFVIGCRLLLALLVLALAGYCAFCFQVTETEHAVVTRFGRPVRVVTEAGLGTKLPWPFESVVRFHRFNRQAQNGSERSVNRLAHGLG